VLSVVVVVVELLVLDSNAIKDPSRARLPTAPVPEGVVCVLCFLFNEFS